MKGGIHVLYRTPNRLSAMKGGIHVPDGDDLGRSEESGLLSSWHESLQLQSTQGTG